MGRHNKLLINESPLQVLPSLAVLVGLNEAIFLQQVHYWCRANREANKTDTHFHDGRWWMYNTIDAWREENFRFWSKRTLRRIVASLLDRGVLLTGNYNRAPFDRTKWYTIDYDALGASDPESVSTSVGPDCPHAVHGGQVDHAQVDNLSGSHVDNLATPIPETNTKTNHETSGHVVVPPGEVFCSIHKTNMKKRTNDEDDIWWSHKVGDAWCQGAPGDQWQPPRSSAEDDRAEHEKYINGEYSGRLKF